MTVLDGEGSGYVNVRNDSYSEGDHIYSVEVDDGEATGCSCPHAIHRGAHCKHQVAVENSPIVLSSASATTAPVATDGGTEEDAKAGRGLRTVTAWEPGSYQTTEEEEVDETKL